MGSHPQQSGAAPASADPRFLARRREVWADMLRLVASAAWLPWVFMKRPDAVALWAPMVAMPTLSLVAAVCARFDLFERHRRQAISLVDVALLTYVIWALGSATTPIIIFYVMVVVAVTMVASRGTSLLVASTVIASYGLVLVLESKGVLPRAPFARPGLGPHETSGGRILAFVSVALSVSTAIGFLLHARRKLERSAEREHQLRLAEKAAQERALELQRQLELAQRMESLGRLAGGIAHDFNNLLTAIRGAFVFGIEEAGENREQREGLEVGLRAARRATDMTQQLLAFSRHLPVCPQVVAPGELIGSARRMLERVIGDDIAVHVDLAPDLGSIRIDPTQFEQVMLNLAVNARDAMPHGGTLSISAKNVTVTEAESAGRTGLSPGPHVEVVVADTGCGMDEETLGRCVEPFFTTKPPGRGTGLGLSTVFGILQQNGGWLAFSSKVGEGTVVRMLLPRTAAPVARPPVPDAEAATGHETVLLVDDEEAIRGVARRALERLGYRVLEAGSGDSAMDVARVHDGAVDVLVTDLMMPGMSGQALAERVRAERPDTKVLFMSGYSAEALGGELLETGDVDFLPKPFEPDQLARRVRKLLDRA